MNMKRLHASTLQDMNEAMAILANQIEANRHDPNRVAGYLKMAQAIELAIYDIGSGNSADADLERPSPDVLRKMGLLEPVRFDERLARDAHVMARLLSEGRPDLLEPVKDLSRDGFTDPRRVFQQMRERLSDVDIERDSDHDQDRDSGMHG